MNRDIVIALLQEAVRDPRASGRRVAGWPLAGRTLWEALALVSILAVLGVYAVVLLSGGSAVGPLPAPFALVAVQALVMLMLALMATWAGQMFGGKGDFAGALRVLIWLQAIMVALQAVQIVAMLVLPPLAGLISLVSLAAVGWLASGMIAGLHGFRSIGLTLLGMVGAMLVLGLALSILLAPFIAIPQ